MRILILLPRVAPFGNSQALLPHDRELSPHDSHLTLEATRVPISRKRVAATRSALNMNPRAGPFRVYPSSVAAWTIGVGRMLDIRNSSLEKTSGSPSSVGGNAIGAVGDEERWALNNSTLPSLLLRA